jgi:transcriptional regulator with XRE-family HTH domain
MSYGYSQSLAQTNKSVSAKSLGVALGRICIEQGISVQAIAAVFGVSRMTVYNWFKGDSKPNPAIADKVQRYINTHKK